MATKATHSRRERRYHGGGRRLLLVLLINLAQLDAMSPIEQIAQASALTNRWVSGALARNGGRVFSRFDFIAMGIRG